MSGIIDTFLDLQTVIGYVNRDGAIIIFHCVLVLICLSELYH